MPPLTWDHAIVAVIVGVATTIIRWGQGRNNRQTDQIYHAVNDGRMERIEAALKSGKGWQEKHETDDEARHNENIERLAAIEEAQKKAAERREYVTELENALARHDPEFAMKLEARRR